MTLKQDGVRLSNDATDFIPAEAKIRPLRDNIIVKPLAWEPSAILEVVHRHKPLRGEVVAVGPGKYPKRYDHPSKAKRTKSWDSKVFRPTEVKVGDIVELGGLEIGGYLFQTVMWGTEPHVMCSEEDVVAVCGE